MLVFLVQIFWRVLVGEVFYSRVVRLLRNHLGPRTRVVVTGVVRLDCTLALELAIPHLLNTEAVSFVGFLVFDLLLNLLSSAREIKNILLVILPLYFRVGFFLTASVFVHIGQ